MRFNKVKDTQLKAKHDFRTRSEMNCHMTTQKYSKKMDDIAEHSKYIKDVKKQLEEEETQLVASL
jgi:hypothetical protein